MLLEDVALPESLDPEAVQPAALVADEGEERIRAGELGTTDVVDLSALPDDLLTSEFGPPPPPAADGESVARIRIPRLGVTKVVVEGVSVDALKKGPGHYPGTPLPGQEGNAAIAGHRTTYGAPFHRLDELEENDLIYVTTLQGSFVYRVTESVIVSPRDVYVLDPSEDNRLTLTTCHPRYSARERLVVTAELLGDAAEADPNQLVDSGEAVVSLPSEAGLDGGDEVAVPTTIRVDELDDPADIADLVPGDEQPEAPVPTTAAPATTEVPANVVAAAPVTEVAHGGIGSDSDAVVPAIFTALLTTFIGIGIWLASGRVRKWQAYVVGAPIFLIALFYFFENFSRAVAWNV